MKLENPALDAKYQAAKRVHDALPRFSSKRPGWRRKLVKLVQRDIAQAVKRERAQRREQRRREREQRQRGWRKSA